MKRFDNLSQIIMSENHVNSASQVENSFSRNKLSNFFALSIVSLTLSLCLVCFDVIKVTATAYYSQLSH